MSEAKTVYEVTWVAQDSTLRSEYYNGSIGWVNRKFKRDHPDIDWLSVHRVSKDGVRDKGFRPLSSYENE